MKYLSKRYAEIPVKHYPRLQNYATEIRVLVSLLEKSANGLFQDIKFSYSPLVEETNKLKKITKNKKIKFRKREGLMDILSISSDPPTLVHILSLYYYLENLRLACLDIHIWEGGNKILEEVAEMIKPYQREFLIPQMRIVTNNIIERHINENDWHDLRVNWILGKIEQRWFFGKYFKEALEVLSYPKSTEPYCQWIASEDWVKRTSNKSSCGIKVRVNRYNAN